MKKYILTLAMYFMSLTSHAAQPEIWWAIRADCNVFMGVVTIQLTEKGLVNNAGVQAYSGTGSMRYESLSFDCKTLNNDSIGCTGQSSITHTQLKFQVARNQDGTFKGILEEPQRGQKTVLGCILSR